MRHPFFLPVTLNLEPLNLRPLRKSHVGQPPSAVHPSFSSRRGRLLHIWIKENNKGDFRRGLNLRALQNYLFTFGLDTGKYIVTY